MSAFLMLFYWVALPYLLFKLATFLYKKSSSLRSKVFICLAYFSYISFFLWIAVGRNMWLDAKVKELCDKNGGIHIYETVELTPDLLDENGEIHIPSKYSMKLGDRYYREMTDKILWEDNTITSVQIIESHHCVMRASDQKILGDKVTYARHGGGLPLPGYNQGVRCPPPRGGMECRIFLKKGE